MRFGTLVAGLVAMTVPTAVSAQSSLPPRPAVSIGAGVSQFDLAGTGTAPMGAVRADFPLGRLFMLEGGVGFARPEQQFGARTSFVVPEIQLQVQLPMGPVMPYLGAGGGIAMDFRPDQAGGLESDITLSAAAGLRWWVTPRLGTRAELRLRGVGNRFTGSAAEWTAGLTWRL
jgi:hypothetical protein